MRISYLIFLGFLVILLLFSFSTFINYRRAEEVSANADYMSRSTQTVRQSQRFQRNILNMVSGLRGYLLTREGSFLQAYDSASSENETILKELSQVIPPGSDQRKRLDTISRLHQTWTEQFAAPLRMARMQVSNSDEDMLAFNRLYRERLLSTDEQNLNLKLQREFREFANYEYEERQRRVTELAASVQQTKQVSFYLTIITFILGLFIAGFLAYGISSRIQRMVSMANSIAAGHYETSLNDTGKDEVSQLARALNRMARVLVENITLLKRKNVELDQFAHIVSHDLKAPLRGIDNVVGWIEEDHAKEVPPKVHDYLQMIKGRIRRGENLIEGILAYARTDKRKGDREPVDVAALVREAWETGSVRPELRLEVAPGLPVLTTERLPLFQVFSNLLGNAVKYHDKAQGIVRVYHEAHPGHYAFFVEDDGPGIAKAYHEKIFVIFQTLHERDSFESTGVGLAIVKKILDARGEKITLVSEPGKGSTFSFTWTHT